MNRSANALVPSAIILAVTAGYLAAGPINPPAGPIAPTQKTLAEVEPRIAVNPANTPGTATSLYRITQPGSYYLTGNLTGASGMYGVEIASAGVTLDLAGFELDGVAGSLSGVYVSVLHAANIRIQNGASRGWGVHGIDAGGAQGARLQDLVVSSNAASGIRVGGSCTVQRCTASANAFGGIVAGESSTVVEDCVAAGNTSDGISISSGCITGCRANGNTGNGIGALFSSTISGCTSDGNGAIGIYAQTGCQVRSCTVSSSGTHAIEVATNNVVSDCACANNGSAITGGAGIHVVYSGNRIDGNSVNTNDYGILCESDHNLVVRNAARGNSVANYAFPANAEYGQIITNPGNAFVATNPWANFVY